MQSPTTEVQEYRKRYGSQGMTPEDVTLLKFLEKRYARESREKAFKRGFEQGLKQGMLRGRIATIEDMLKRGASWKTIAQFTGVDEVRLLCLRKELVTMQNDHSAHDP